MSTVIACIDGSSATPAVCDCAGWASQLLAAPVTLLHVLEQPQAQGVSDLSGAIGLGSRELLLQQLTTRYIAYNVGANTLGGDEQEKEDGQ